MGVLDSLGYLRITDPTKDVIKSGGEWVSSIDLESFAQESTCTSYPGESDDHVLAESEQAG